MLVWLIDECGIVGLKLGWEFSQSRFGPDLLYALGRSYYPLWASVPPPVTPTGAHMYMSHLGFSYSEGSRLEKGPGQSVPIFSLLLNNLPLHSRCVLSAGPVGTHLHFLCPVPVSPPPGAHQPSWLTASLGNKGAWGISIWGRILLLLQVVVATDGCLWS